MNFWAGIKSDFFGFGMNPRLCTVWREYIVWDTSLLRIISLKANCLGTEIMRWHIDAIALLLCPLVSWKSTDLGTFGKVRPWIGRPDLRTLTKDTSWIEDEMERVGKHLSDLWRQPNHWPISIVILTWLSPSWMAVSLCTDLAVKDLLPDVTFHSFSGQEIAGNKTREFPDLVPFPLPISGGSPISSHNNGEEDWLRLIRTDERGELTWMLSRNRLKWLRGSICCVLILPIVPQSGPIFLPLEYLGMVR